MHALEGIGKDDPPSEPGCPSIRGVLVVLIHRYMLIDCNKLGLGQVWVLATIIQLVFKPALPGHYWSWVLLVFTKAGFCLSLPLVVLTFR